VRPAVLLVARDDFATAFRAGVSADVIPEDRAALAGVDRDREEVAGEAAFLVVVARDEVVRAAPVVEDVAPDAPAALADPALVVVVLGASEAAGFAAGARLALALVRLGAAGVSVAAPGVAKGSAVATRVAARWRAWRLPLAGGCASGSGSGSIIAVGSGAGGGGASVACWRRARSRPRAPPGKGPEP
jgi:hypothetical protein